MFSIFQDGTLVNGWIIMDGISYVLGFIMNLIFEVLNFIGIPNIGIAIIVFTFVIKGLMAPMTFKQQKTSKLNSIITPEVQAIQKKYKDKKDNESMMKMQAEIKAVYARYGTSQMGGCLQLLIQMPILFALYGVVRNIPNYVPIIKQSFTNIVDAISQVPNYLDTLKDVFGVQVDNVNSIIEGMNVFTADQWNQLKEVFWGQADIITENVTNIDRMNNFLGVNMSQAPGLVLAPAILIPILAGVTQYISTRLINSNSSMDPDDPTAASMKMMNTIMPLMSAIFAISLPAGLGIYWIATAVCQIIVQLISNSYFKKIGVDGIIEKNLAKINKKRAKKGLPPQKVISAAKMNTKSKGEQRLEKLERNKERIKSLEEKRDANKAKVNEILNASKNGGNNAPKMSLAQKANMVASLNEKNGKGSKK